MGKHGKTWENMKKHLFLTMYCMWVAMLKLPECGCLLMIVNVNANSSLVVPQVIKSIPDENTQMLRHPSSSLWFILAFCSSSFLVSWPLRSLAPASRSQAGLGARCLRGLAISPLLLRSWDRVNSKRVRK